jgi:hypothetical protein
MAIFYVPRILAVNYLEEAHLFSGSQIILKQTLFTNNKYNNVIHLISSNKLTGRTPYSELIFSPENFPKGFNLLVFFLMIRRKILKEKFCPRAFGGQIEKSEKIQEDIIGSFLGK